jgi:hypothetical protein
LSGPGLRWGERRLDDGGRLATRSMILASQSRWLCATATREILARTAGRASPPLAPKV